MRQPLRAWLAACLAATVPVAVPVSGTTLWPGDFGELVRGARAIVHGRYRSVLIGAPTLERGEEVVLFLSGHDPATPYLLGLGQGVFRVTGSRTSGEGLVTPMPLLSQSPAAQHIVRGDPSRRALPLRDFSRLIASILAAPVPAMVSPRRDRP
jgi:hypothetical protein